MLSDEEFRDLLERSALIKDMSEHPGWALLADRARVNMFARQRSLIQGHAKSWEDYLVQTSWMDGVSFILDLPTVVAAEVEREIHERKQAEEEENEEENE